MFLKRPTSRNEAGAIAVMAGLMSVMLLSVSAIAVDLGNAYVRKGDVQSQADLAALAGAAGNNLPAPVTTHICPNGDPRPEATDKAVVDVADYLNKNAPQNDAASTAVTPAELVDCNRANGEVIYGILSKVDGTLQPSLNQLTAITPEAWVKFGLAEVMGFSGTNVSATATAQIKSPELFGLPFYAFAGCDYGQQTIAEPNNGHAANTVLLASPNDTNAAVLTSLTTNPASDPVRVALGSTATSLTIAGSNLAGVTAVGFFESGNATTGPAPVVVDTGLTVTGTSVSTPALPTTVTSVQDTWFVRVKIGGVWSAATATSGGTVILKALPLPVGDPVLTCAQGSNSGNFGTLQLPNTTQTGEWQQIAANVAGGLQHSLGIYPNAGGNWLCDPTLAPAKGWPSDGTNCVGTKPGMVASAAQAGFIDGIGSLPGLLTNVSDGTGCAEDGEPATTTFGGKTINNDTLSCFLTDDTTNIGMIDSATYPDSLDNEPVLSSKIFKSPRFVFSPVLGVQPGNGASSSYQIIGFRAGFITSQPNSATRQTALPVNDPNGLGGTGSISSLQIVFINAKALPPLPDTGTTDYSGSGPKVLQLVN
jgi:hypothetical protein